MKLRPRPAGRRLISGNKIAACGDDDVVIQAYAEQIPGFPYALRDLPVLLTDIKRPGRVVVSKDDRCRTAEDSARENLPWMDKRGHERTVADLERTGYLPAAVERNKPQAFLRELVGVEQVGDDGSRFFRRVDNAAIAVIEGSLFDQSDQAVLVEAGIENIDSVVHDGTSMPDGFSRLRRRNLKGNTLPLAQTTTRKAGGRSRGTWNKIKAPVLRRIPYKPLYAAKAP